MKSWCQNNNGHTGRLSSSVTITRHDYHPTWQTTSKTHPGRLLSYKTHSARHWTRLSSSKAIIQHDSHATRQTPNNTHPARFIPRESSTKTEIQRDSCAIVSQQTVNQYDCHPARPLSRTSYPARLSPSMAVIQPNMTYPARLSLLQCLCHHCHFSSCHFFNSSSIWTSNFLLLLNLRYHLSTLVLFYLHKFIYFQFFSNPPPLCTTVWMSFSGTVIEAACNYINLCDSICKCSKKKRKKS